MKADLHIHSHLSDGYLSIKQLIDYGKQIGLDHMAITDHDTLSGVLTAMTYGKQVGMNIIPGLEISTRNPKTGRSVHILCYYPKDFLGYQEFLDQTLLCRREIKLKTAEELSKHFPITIEEVLEASKDSDSIYNPHLMLPFWNKGFTPSVIGDFFKKEAGSKSERYIKIPYPSTYDALDLIDRCGGIAVIAHPGEYDSLEITEELARDGRIQGIEYNHPRNTKEDQEEILRIAKTYNLFLTGGTDFHGPTTHSVNPLGSYLCPEEGLERLLAYN